MLDFMHYGGLFAIGATVAVPLAYGLATLLGMTHKEFRPIFHGNMPDGTTTPILLGQAEPQIEEHQSRSQQGRL